MERRLLNEDARRPTLLCEAKRLGFCDEQIGAARRPPARARSATLRDEWGIRPVYKMVDTCAAEFEAATPYFYCDLRGRRTRRRRSPARSARGHRLRPDPHRPGDRVRLLLGAGGAGAAGRAASRSIMINSNPETVSTDFDASDRLYFEPLDEESVRDILRERAPATTASAPPVIVQFGGQTAINLAEPLHGARRADRRLQRRRDRPGRRPRPVRGLPARRSASRSRRARPSRPLERGAARSPSRSATRCSCGPPTCSAGGRWRSSTDADELARYLAHARRGAPEQPDPDRQVPGRPRGRGRCHLRRRATC